MNIQITESEYQKLIKLSRMANMMLLCSHVYLLIMFSVMHIVWMIGANLISIVVYALNFFWPPSKLKSMFICVYVEILLHMILAIGVVGWSCGFQLYSFALILTIYYGDYICVKLNGKRMYPRRISIGVAVLYVLLYLASHWVEPLCPLDNPNMYPLLYLVNALFVIVFFIIYVENFECIVLQTETRLAEAAEKDELTGMSNRRNMQTSLNELFYRKDQVKEISIAILDIDDFKHVNDIYGHNAGDFILKGVAQKIYGKESESIHTCRWGGEEFLMLSVGEKAYENLSAAIQKVLEEVRNEKYQYEDNCIGVTVSAGVSKWSGKEKFEHTISRADGYLYEAKERGKDQYVGDK